MTRLTGRKVSASPLLTYRLPDHVDSQQLMKTLDQKHDVVVKTVPKEWLNGHRISTHLFNDERDLERFVKALRKELGGAGQ